MSNTNPLVRIEVFQEGIKIRSEEEVIKPDEWQKILDLLKKDAAIQVIGDLQEGKTTAIRNLIQSDKSRIYVVLDSQKEYDLPETNQIKDLTESSRIDLPHQVMGAKGMFKMWTGVFMSEKLPENYVLVVENALIYLDSGLEELASEANRFIKTIIIAPRRLFDFCPAVKVERCVR